LTEELDAEEGIWTKGTGSNRRIEKEHRLMMSFKICIFHQMLLGRVTTQKTTTDIKSRGNFKSEILLG
jgi:hypothetical protein